MLTAPVGKDGWRKEIPDGWALRWGLEVRNEGLTEGHGQDNNGGLPEGAE